jgi:hypothetical protein
VSFRPGQSSPGANGLEIAALLGGLVGAWGTQGGGRAVDVRAPARASTAALPCLNTINCNGGKKDTLNQLSAGHKKTAFALKINVLWLIERYGLV